MGKIEALHLSKVYNQGQTNEVEALKDVSFRLEEGEFAAVLGPSGAGKSTLLNLLGGMDRPTEGQYLVDGLDVASFNEKDLSIFRRKDVGFVFQFYNLLPQLTALENVELSASVAAHPLDSREVLKQVGLEDRLKNFPSELSGGEQQRVAIARAIVKNPKLLLCDEPTGALDSKTGAQIVTLLLEVAEKYHKTVIIVTHNSKIADVSRRIIRIADGHIVSDEVNSNPRRPEDIVW